MPWRWGPRLALAYLIGCVPGPAALTTMLWWLINHYPQEVTTAMDKRKIVKRSKINSFVGVCNYNHLVSTRSSVDIPLDKTVINKDVFSAPTLKSKASGEVKVKFEEPQKTGKNK
ncbi:60S ribosomal protein L27 [Cricetulus griseus]|uniref:60S ribosomal protein L27 n=1 Tax=Cricetulus griseus TaxID=10029 RepID=G3HUS0_CRIGR|nr:60S ribosomal protein L27 [Cricetulus griseus]